MPSYSDSPFGPADPAQWWRTRSLPRILVQPNAPANSAAGNPVGPDGIDDWIVPGRAQSPDNYPDDWFVPGNARTDDSYPDDWIYPDNRGSLAPAAGPGTTPALSPQPTVPNPTISNRPLPPPDPFAAYWSLIPASRVGAMAWDPPIFPNSLGQFPSAAPPRYELPLSVGGQGLLGGIPKMLADSAGPFAPSPVAGHGLLGAIAKLSGPRDISSEVGGQGLLGAIARLQPANAEPPASPPDLWRSLITNFSGQPPSRLPSLANLAWSAPSNESSDSNLQPGAAQDLRSLGARLAASYSPGSPPFMSPDLVGSPGDNSRYAYPTTGPLKHLGPITPAEGRPPPGDVDPFTQTETDADPNVIPVADDYESLEHYELRKLKERTSGGRDGSIIAPSKIVPAFPPPRPPPPRPSSPAPAAVPPASPGQGVNGPRTSGALSGPAPVDKPEGDAGNRPGAGAAAGGGSSPTPIGDEARSPTFLKPDWQKLIPDIRDALDAGGGRLPAVISAGLPKYDGKTTYGVLITNEGDVVTLQSAAPNPRYSNYPPAGHVEGKAAIWIRDNGSTGGVVYHNNTDGTCGRCNSQLGTLLPEGVRAWVAPPAEAIAKNVWARQGLTDYVGNSDNPKPPPVRKRRSPRLPQQDPQPDFFDEQQP